LVRDAAIRRTAPPPPALRRARGALALGTGVSSELRRPLGISIVGALIVSQALTLYTIPVGYLELDRCRLWLARLRFGRARSAVRAS